MFRLDRTVQRALELRKELDAAKLGRRELAQLGLIAGSAYDVRGASLRRALAANVPAAPLEPWADELPIPRAAPSSDFPYARERYQYCANGYDPVQYASLKISMGSPGTELEFAL